jgi:hypothetical protein
VFRTFVGAIEGTPPVLMTENMNELFLLGQEFGFANLLSQVTSFISEHSVVDSEAPKGATDITEENLQVKGALCPLQKALSGVQNTNFQLARGNESLQQSLSLLQKEVLDLREANKVQMRDIAEMREGRAREAAELSRLAGEIASQAQTSRLQKEENDGLGRSQAKSDKEMSEFRAQFGREQEAMKLEIAALGKQLGEEAAACGKFAQELESLKRQFAEERTKWDEASKQNMREHESLRNPRTQFPFTSDPPEQGKMPAGGVIAHLTAKCGGNVHEKGAVEITASSVYRNNSSYAPPNAADLGDKDSIFHSDNEPAEWIGWDFKALRIEPTHYTIRTYWKWPNWSNLKSWAVEGSDDGASWTEIDRRENNSDLNDRWAVKTFAVP